MGSKAWNQINIFFRIYIDHFYKKSTGRYSRMNRLALIKEAISAQITLDTLTELRLTREGNIATIWFNTPAALNAISNRMTD